MPELERALELLAAEVEWPATPAFDLRVGERRRRRWLAVVPVLAAVAVAFAVPQSRAAILRVLHLGGVTVEHVGTLPPAQERALRASVGMPVSAADAQSLLGRPFASPGGERGPLYRSGLVVSTLLAGPAVLSEFRAGDVPILKKFAASAGTRWVEAAPGVPALWIPGRHVLFEPSLPARYAGATLLWQRGEITFRLEGKGLTLPRARALAGETIGDAGRSSG